MELGGFFFVFLLETADRLVNLVDLFIDNFHLDVRRAFVFNNQAELGTLVEQAPAMSLKFSLELTDGRAMTNFLLEVTLQGVFVILDIFHADVSCWLHELVLAAGIVRQL